MPFAPMLAATLKDLSTLRFPLVASPKVDGIRCIKLSGLLYSRNLKPIRNVYVQRLFQGLPDGCDGELVHGDFSQTSSAVMSLDGAPQVQYRIFDMVYPELSYIDRLQHVPTEHALGNEMVRTVDDVLGYEGKCIEDGYEGIMLRAPLGPYLYGRATLKSQHLLKWKRFDDDEATIVGVEEGWHNENPQQRDELGRNRRPGGKSGCIRNGTLGRLIVQHPTIGEFRIGGGLGMSLALRQDIWNRSELYIGCIIKFRYQGIGAKGKPRFPRFVGFRHADDR